METRHQWGRNYKVFERHAYAFRYWTLICDQKFKIPIFYSQVEDCTALLMGPERYNLELNKKPKTWFLTPGWTRMGVESVFRELQLNNFAEKNITSLQAAQ